MKLPENSMSTRFHRRAHKSDPAASTDEADLFDGLPGDKQPKASPNEEISVASEEVAFASGSFDRELANWQGRIAVDSKEGNGLDSFRAALNWATLVSSDNALGEKAKQEIWEAAERHLADRHGLGLIEAIYRAVFPKETDGGLTNNIALDANTGKVDDLDEIKRLANLTPIQYERERKSAAERLGIDRVSTLDAAVKAACAENGDTKGQGRPLELPVIELWPEPVNGADLLDEICNVQKRYLVLPEGGVETQALWTVHTHAFECFSHSPRLAITSPEKGCGKTTDLDVIEKLVARPLPTSNATTASIFRTVEKAKPTLLIDEADTFLKDNEELRGVLNAGHRRGGQIIRTVGDDHEPRQFSTWTPAAIAMIGRLPDTLEDRSVSITLRRRRPTENVQRFRSDRAQDLKELARKAARWCDDNRHSLSASDPDTGTLMNRAADNWRPLFAIADKAGGEWPKRARAVAEAAENKKQDQSTRTMVLSDIRDIFTAHPGVDRLASVELTNALGAMENRPWPEWRNSKPITQAGLARLLAPFKILSGTKRDGDHTFKGYYLSDFADAFETYLPNQNVTPSQPSNDVHCDTFQSVTADVVVTVPKASQPNNDGLCDGVTVSSDEEEAEWTL